MPELHSTEVHFEWPILGGSRSDAYIIDTTDRGEAVQKARKVFEEYHGDLLGVEATTRRCNADGTT